MVGLEGGGDLVGVLAVQVRGDLLAVVRQRPGRAGGRLGFGEHDQFTRLVLDQGVAETGRLYGFEEDGEDPGAGQPDP